MVPAKGSPGGFTPKIAESSPLRKDVKERPVSQQADYFLGQSSEEQARLQRQAAQLEQRSREDLERAGIQRGWRVLDVGCGPQGILHVLADQVGPTGTVVGLERDPNLVARAREFIAKQGFTNVEVVQGDARATALPRASFDLVHERLVLVNVPKPEEVLAEMVSLSRPGGVVVAAEVDWVSWLCYPPHPAWTRIMEAMQAVSLQQGQDCFIGRRLVKLMRAAGVVDVKQEVSVNEWPAEHPRRMQIIQFMENVRERAIAHGLFSDTELTSLLETLKKHLEDPETLQLSLVSFRAWGRKPL
jgi:ubiquinone/menaquinone biosynthesis C-methylase UbiE